MNDRTFDLLVCGHPSVDIMFSGLPQWPELGMDIYVEGLGVCAGTSFNTPAAANRLGLHVGYIAMIGTDPWSAMVREEFTAEGLPTDFLQIVDRETPFVSVALNLDGDRGFVSYEGASDEDTAELGRYATDIVSVTPARHLHAYAGDEPPELTAIAHERGMTVSLDTWGGPWWETPASFDDQLSGTDIVFANEPEALAMTGQDDVERAALSMAKRCPCAVVKLAENGSIGVDANGLRRVGGDPGRVVDSTGAGDAFNAGFLRGWLAELPLEQCLTLGNICGARAVEAYGGYRGCPREDELRRIAASRDIVLT